MLCTRPLMGSTDQVDPSFFLLQNFMNIDGTLCAGPTLTLSGPQKPLKLTALKIEYV